MWVEAEAEKGYLEVFRAGRKVQSPLVLRTHIGLPHSTMFIANQLWYTYGQREWFQSSTLLTGHFTLAFCFTLLPQPPAPTPRAMTPRRLWGWLKAEGQSCITFLLIRCIIAAYDGPQHTHTLSILLIDWRERVGSPLVGTGWNLCFIRRLVQNSCFVRDINSR